MSCSGHVSGDGTGKIDARNPNSETDRNQRVGKQNHVNRVVWIDGFFRHRPGM